LTLQTALTDVKNALVVRLPKLGQSGQWWQMAGNSRSAWPTKLALPTRSGLPAPPEPAVQATCCNQGIGWRSRRH